MNIELSQEAQTAIYSMVHKSGALKPADVAQMLGDPHKAVLNNANVNMPNHVFTLAKIEAIMQYTENPALLKVWAHKLGYVLVKADDVESEKVMGVLESLLCLNIKNGSINEHVHQIMSDGLVTTERDQTMQILDDLADLIPQLRKAVELEHSKTALRLQTNKA